MKDLTLILLSFKKKKRLKIVHRDVVEMDLGW